MIKVLSFLSSENCLAGHGFSTTALIHFWLFWILKRTFRLSS